jgi:C-terminal processing protease CtpA/Prc
MGLLSLDSSLNEYHTLYDTQGLQEDIKLYQRALEASHPALYWHISKDSLDAVFEKSYSLLDKPMTVSYFHKIIRYITAAIGDYHMSTHMPQLYSHLQSREEKYFPFDVTFANGKGYIFNNNSNDPSVAIGSEIIRINDEPFNHITKELFHYIIIDNNKETFKYKTLSNSFSIYYNSFYKQPHSFKVEIIKDGKKRNINVEALALKDIEQNRLKNVSNKKNFIPPLVKHSPRTLSLQFLPQYACAVLQIKSFSDYLIRKDGQEIETYIDSTFAEIRKRGVKNLIIDIRGNGGGSIGNGEYLFSYLTDKPFRVAKSYEVKSIPLKYWDFSGVKDSEGKPIELKQEEFVRTQEGAFRIKEDYHAIQERYPKPNAFNGEVYVLIDGLVGSQASSFASTVDHFKRGTTIGEETGGNYNGNTGGTFANLILPHSNLQIQMFVFKIIRFTNTINDSRGVIPVYKVEPSIEDKLTGKDVELMTALNMIKQATQKDKNYKPTTKRQARHSSL